ncbi:MAG: metal-dependent hydrolase [Dehalococcoidia bacterium]
MYVLSHTGITLGIAWAGARFLGWEKGALSHASASGYASIDYRLVLVGALLPDLIDKPLGMWALADLLSNGRVFAHTLLFNLVLVVIGVMLLLWKGKTGWLTLGLSSGGHLVLDQMWQSPVTLLWPVYGYVFPRHDLGGYPWKFAESLVTSPQVYLWEVLGAVILLLFTVHLVRQGALWSFLREGKVEKSRLLPQRMRADPDRGVE